MTGGKQFQLLDKVSIELKNRATGSLLPVYIDVYDNSLSRKWLDALKVILKDDLHLEKNYCFFGFPDGERSAEYICEQINRSIAAINASDLDYNIHDHFTVENTITTGPVGEDLPGHKLVQEKMNWLHRYFEDLQGTSADISAYYKQANDATRWHIRQLNLLCHEYESLVLSMRKKIHAPEWRRPSQLMCWLNAPRFTLDENDYELFGVDTLARPLGGVFVGVNKAVGKHHWEVFHDEGRDSRIDELVTTSLSSQTEATGDFDIEWANNPGNYEFFQREMADFRTWLVANGFDPEDKCLTIGHPQIGQVDLNASFGTEDFETIWALLNDHLDVHSVSTANHRAEYPYHWSDQDYMAQQIRALADHV